MKRSEEIEHLLRIIEQGISFYAERLEFGNKHFEELKVELREITDGTKSDADVTL